MNASHSFLVPAFGHSPFLKECLESLRLQTQPSPILIATSTPFDGIAEVSRSFGAELYIHGPNKGIAHDWNTGIRRASTDWVTIAHQDDIYLPTYKEAVIHALQSVPDATLAFTDYAEITDDGMVRRETKLLKIKKALLQLGFLGRSSISQQFSKLNTLRFGSPIPCPSVTLRNDKTTPHFEEIFRLNMDWAAWLHLAKEPGSFVWVKEDLMLHRIHPGSETTSGIRDGHRTSEDIEILSRIWPKLIAKIISKSYGLAYRSNSQ